MLSHSVECQLLHKVVVGNKADNAVSASQAIRGPTEEFDIGVIELVLERRGGVLGIRLSNAAINCVVLAILVVVIFVELPDVVRWIADYHRNRSSFLAINTICVRLRE